MKNELENLPVETAIGLAYLAAKKDQALKERFDKEGRVRMELVLRFFSWLSLTPKECLFLAETLNEIAPELDKHRRLAAKEQKKHE